ncbi:MAG: hypothetical protein ACOC2W_03725 [bacterium]
MKRNKKEILEFLDTLKEQIKKNTVNDEIYLNIESFIEEISLAGLDRYYSAPIGTKKITIQFHDEDLNKFQETKEKMLKDLNKRR